MFPINGSGLGPGGSIRRESRDRVKVKKSGAKHAIKRTRTRLLLVDSYSMFNGRWPNIHPHTTLIRADFISPVRSKAEKPASSKSTQPRPHHTSTFPDFVISFCKSIAFWKSSASMSTPSYGTPLRVNG